ncbi:class I SAM-dependent methyltransferase [Parachitinimonas caeni]|uniref:Class I SAM-dependent methyltransferase n=1 Tax=Parachitinimonas caeni TaxID=3031301 RepID=A0ABT7DUW5_9NEIS|nr:class I SAM-dependent methyltransferase [Parachitinimonas caeni]MDK2123857.1 class I SAM-dependent methyltransferase [Parachitinimonas caeni]
MNHATLQQLSPQPGENILEIGFGGGYLLRQLLQSHPHSLVSGLDVSADMVELASKRLRPYLINGSLHLKQGCIEQLPYRNANFDKICTVNTLYFWSDPAKALAECHRTLRKNGILVLCFNDKTELAKWPGHRFGFQLYDKVEIGLLLEKHGFKTIKIESFHDPKQGKFHCLSARREKVFN